MILLYNSPVNSPKIIHVLLIGLLCYGQLVSHVHMVSHLQAHDNECSSQFVDGCNAAKHSVVEMLHAASQKSDHVHGGADDSVENDCSIYHALLNLSDALCPIYSDGTVALQSTVKSNFFLTHTIVDALNNASIRAPPVHS